MASINSRAVIQRFIGAMTMAVAGVALAQPVTYELVASGLDRPVDIQNAHDGSNRLFVVEQLRGIRVIKDGVLLATPFLDLSGVVSTTTPEAGIIGLAFDPSYATNHRFFVSYVRASDRALRVESYAASASNPDVADASSMAEAITIAHPDSVYNYGGYIAFGPDGMLFVGTGNRSGSDAQDLTSLWGKLLRLDVHGASGYVVPPDNYYVATANPTARPEIVARGLNNPRKFSFDPVMGDLYIGDVGAGSATQEIDTMPNGYWRSTDMNYGAPLCFGASACPAGIATPQSVVTAYAVTGGVVYRGRKSQQLYGRYLYGGYGYSLLWSAAHDGAAWYNSVLTPSPPGMLDAGALGTDESGEVYVATYSDGNVYAIAGPASPVGVSRYGRATGQRMDFDGNGREDMVWWTVPGPSYTVWLMNGPSAVTTMPLALPTPASGWWPQLWDVGRFHAGTRSDRLWRDVDASYWMDVNDASGTTTTRIRAGGGAWEVVQGGDFNGDGMRDLLWRKDNLYGIWLMNGSTPLAVGTIASPDPAYPYAAADPAVVGDFDGDGKSDVLWHRPGDGSAALSLMDGLATKGSATVFVPAGRPWAPVAGADFDGDGKTDIVWTLPNGALGIWLMNGSAPSSYGVVYWGNTGLSFLYARDVDGDGKADLVFEDDVSGGASVWLMDGLSIRQQVHVDPGGGLYVGGIGDFNGDGKADLVWLPQIGGISTSLEPFIFVPSPVPAMPGWSLWH